MRVTGTDRRRAGLDYGQLVRGSGELRRRTAHSGDERQRTSDERGVLEGEANSSRQEWGGSAAFYREQEGEERSLASFKRLSMVLLLLHVMERRNEGS